MTTTAKQEVSNENWKRAFIGLPADFLRLSSRDVQESTDRQVAYALQQQQQFYPAAANISGRLSITVAQAKLVKNYGLTRMDPYVRLRVGHFVYETQTDSNGGKNPRWNRVFHAQLPKGVTNLSVEIYDECNFSMDEIIAWAEIRIPDVVLNGETHEDWYPLSGKTGEGREGMIDLVLSFNSAPANCMYNYQQPVMVVPNVSTRSLPVFVAPQVAPVVVAQQPGVVPAQQLQQLPQQPQQQQLPPVQHPESPPAPPLTESDINQIAEMFPNCDKEVIKSVADANNGNREATINSLLQMTN